MQRQRGFSLVEVLVSVAIMLVVMGATLSALSDAMHANEAVTSMADLQDNLRAGMNLMVRDIVQAGSGIPIGGIPIPYTNTANNPTGAPVPLPINRPSPPGQTYTFPVQSTITDLTTGYQLGPTQLGQKTDMITVIYGDNTLPWSTMAPVNSTAAPNCVNGSIAATQVKFDTTTAGCATAGVTAGNVSVSTGDLLMLSNSLGNVLVEVTSIGGNAANFIAGDALDLNGQTAASGTIKQIESNPNAVPPTFPPTSVTRIWMITYFLDATTNPLRPQLMRQVNARPAQAVGQVMEGLQISYDVVNAVATAPANNARNIIAPDSPNQVRKVNLYLAARSETPYTVSKQYFRNNLVTQISMRSLAFQNIYN